MARIVSGPYVAGQVTSKETGAPLGGGTVTVSATVYTSPELTSGTTSVTVDGNGGFSFYASPGNYTFTASNTKANPIEPVEVLGQELGVNPSGGPGGAGYAKIPAVVDQGLWVAPGGSDTNDGLSAGNALLTIGAALAKLPTGAGSRGKITILPGTYTLPAGGVSALVDNYEIVGVGGVGQGTGMGGGPGGVTIIVGNGDVGFTFGDTNNRFRGPTIRNLTILANSGTSAGGIHMKGYSNYFFERVNFTGFTGGYGLFLDDNGAGGLSMYGEFVGCNFVDCALGMDNKGGSGVTIIGGGFLNGDNNGDVTASSTGLKSRGANNEVRVFGTRFEGYSTHVDLQSGGGRGSFFTGTRHEGFDIGIQTNQIGTSVIGGAFDNTLYSSLHSRGTSGTAFKTLAGASEWRFFPNEVAGSVTTEIDADTTSPGVFLNAAGTFSSGFTAPVARFQVNPRADATAGVFQAHTSQTADIFQVRNGGGTTKAGALASGTLFSDDSAQGLVLKDSGGHYWRLTVSTAGVLVTADLGASRPTA